MPSMLGHALLGLLARGPATGYDLSRRMRDPIGYFWTARHSQIYPELARLEEAGQIRHTEVSGRGPRPNKVYALTAAGRRELRDWLVSPMTQAPVRDEEVLRAYNLWQLDPDAARAFVTERRAWHAEQLASFEEIRAELDAQPPAADRAEPVWGNRAALEAGLLSRRAGVEWCDWMLSRLSAQEDQPDVS